VLATGISMDPLSTVENILGRVETWLSTIIDLFITKPCTISVQFVACFGIDNYYVSCAVKDSYTTWDNLPHKTHFARYYFVASKRWMWLNGKYGAQNEAVYPEDDVMNSIGAFGTENADVHYL